MISNRPLFRKGLPPAATCNADKLLKSRQPSPIVMPTGCTAQFASMMRHGKGLPVFHSRAIQDQAIPTPVPPHQRRKFDYLFWSGEEHWLRQAVINVTSSPMRI